MPSAAPEPIDTKQLVQRFQVCWDVWPEYTFINHEKRQIGFELDLAGTHEDGEKHPEPGCEKCLEIYQSLIRIAEDALPERSENVTYQFEPYDQAIQYSPRRGNRPEVILRVRIIHRNAFERPLDAAQVQFMEDLQKRLKALDIGQR